MQILTINAQLILGNGLILNAFSAANWIVMILVAASVLHNNLLRTQGLPEMLRRLGSKCLAFIFFAAVFTLNILVSWYSYDGKLQQNALDYVAYKKISNCGVFLLPILLHILYKLRIPLNLTFLNRTIFTGKNLIFELLIKTLLNYFIALVVSVAFWTLIYRRLEKNTSEKNSKFWHIAQCFSIGLLWHNLLTAFMPNFVIFIPRKIDAFELILFLFSILVVLFLLLENIVQSPRNVMLDVSDDRLNLKIPTLFNMLYTLLMLLFSHYSTISIITPWMFLGLRSGIKIASGMGEGELKLKLSLKKILNDMYTISIGIVVAIVFTKIIRV
ncbi:MAG: hypothetical protein LBP39_02445 [Rickettsiales bacterium]|jgi:hypothetical protein|nr:hypothetical protein [Rickettsiales bacterium]